MNIYEIFNEASGEISDENYHNLQRFTMDVVKTQENNRIRVNNMLKKFTPFYKELKQEAHIISDGSEVS